MRSPTHWPYELPAMERDNVGTAFDELISHRRHAAKGPEPGDHYDVGNANHTKEEMQGEPPNSFCNCFWGMP